MNKIVKAKLIGPIILSVICVIIGVILLYMGISGANRLSKSTEHYVRTDGYFTEYMLYSESAYDHIKNKHTAATYLLTYSYFADGVEYRITTDYATAVIPEYNSVKQIRYDPDNPEKAVISGAGSNSALILVGIMFVTVPVIICVGGLFYFGVITKGFEFLGFAMGTVLTVIGYGAIYALTDGFSIVKAFQKVGPVSIIPAALIVAGIYQMIKCLFPGKKNVEK